MLGPTLAAIEPASISREKSRASRPNEPKMVNFGYSSPMAAPILAVWPANSCSARRTSGAPSQQISRNAHGNFRRRVGDGSLLGKKVIHRAGRGTKQNAQPIECLLVARQKIWNLARRRFRVGPRLNHIQLGTQFRVQSFSCELQSPLLNIEVISGNLQALLVRSGLHIVGRHVGQEDHQRIAIVFDRHPDIRVSRLDQAVESSESVDFPGTADPKRPLIGS